MRYPQIQINPLLFFLFYPNSRKRSEVIEGAKGGEVEKNLREELEKVLFKRELACRKSIIPAETLGNH